MTDQHGTPLAKENLLAAGYREFSWNGFAVMEYWKSIASRLGNEFMQRVGVRFGETPGSVNVYVFGTSAYIRAPGVHNIEDLESLVRFLAPRQETSR